MATILSLGFIEEFLNSLSENGNSPNTIRAYRADLMGFWNWHQTKTYEPEELDRAARAYLTQYKDTWAPKTLRRKMSALRSFTAHFYNGDKILTGYRAPTPAKGEPHPLPEGIEGVMAMIEVADTPQRRALVGLCGLMGLRVHEALMVRPSHFDRVTMTLAIRGKGSRHRKVPISRAAWHVIHDAYLDALEGDRLVVGMKDRGARQLLTRLGHRAGLERAVASHDLRATLLTAAYDKSKDLRVVQEIAGHASSATTELYTGVRMNSMREAIEVV